MIQNTRCRILGIYTTGHLGFEFVGYTIFLNFCHGKAKTQLRHKWKSSIFPALLKVVELALDMICLMDYLWLR